MLVFILALALANPAGASGPSDFDFNYGTWKSRIHRNLHPLSGGAESMELTGTVSVHKIWEGALLEEIEADGPKGHWEGLTFFLYTPKTKQWSQSFASSTDGILQVPTVGEFKDGKGELVASDTVDGRSVLVRTLWTPSPSSPDAHRYDEFYSDDAGKTWHAAFGAELVRAPLPPAAKAELKSHDFDFEMGKWKSHTRRLVHPLSGSQEWVEREGIAEIIPLWGGKGNLVHITADSAAGHVEVSALRLYNPLARQWNIHFVSQADGDLGPPLVGEFKDGRGVFYDQEDFNGRVIWVRFTVFPVSAKAARSEQAFSDDQGKTWETNFTTDYTRIE